MLREEGRVAAYREAVAPACVLVARSRLGAGLRGGAARWRRRAGTAQARGGLAGGVARRAVRAGAGRRGAEAAGR